MKTDPNFSLQSSNMTPLSLTLCSKTETVAMKPGMDPHKDCPVHKKPHSLKVSSKSIPFIKNAAYL